MCQNNLPGRTDWKTVSPHSQDSRVTARCCVTTHFIFHVSYVLAREHQVTGSHTTSPVPPHVSVNIYMFPGNNTHLSNFSIPISSVSAALQRLPSAHCTGLDKLFTSLCGLIPKRTCTDPDKFFSKLSVLKALVDRKFGWDVGSDPPCNTSLQCRQSVHSSLKFSSDTKCQACGYFPNELNKARRSSTGLCNVEIPTESFPLQHTSAAEGFPAISPY